MDLGFDFGEFYKEMQAKTEIPLNFAGMDLDQATETSEWITNNVMYYVSHIWADGVLYDGNYRLLVRVQEGQEYRDYFARQWHSVDAVIESGAAPEWEPGQEREQYIELEPPGGDDGFSYFILPDNSTTGTGTPIVANRVILTLFPRYEAITNDPGTVMGERFRADTLDGDPMLFRDVDQNILGTGKGNWWAYGPVSPGASLAVYMRCMYGLLGAYGTGDRSKPLTWIFGSRNGMWRTDRNAVFSRKQFKNWINRLTEQCAANGIGVKVDVYDSSYSMDVEVADATKDDYRQNKSLAKIKHHIYQAAVKNSDWTRTDMDTRTSFDDAYGKELPKFLAKFGNGESGNADYVARISYADGESQNALIPSMRDVFKAWYYDPGDLEDSFNDHFQSVFEGMSRVPLGWRTVGPALSNTLFSLAGQFKTFPTDLGVSDDGVMVPASSKVAVDLSYVLNQMAMNGYHLASGGDTGDYFDFYPRIVQRGSMFVSDRNLLDSFKIIVGDNEPGVYCVAEYTTCSFTVSSNQDKTTYARHGVPKWVIVPTSDRKAPNDWSGDSSRKYSVRIAKCVDIDGKREGSSDFVSQNAPADVLRVRAVNSGAGGEELKAELVEYYNYMLSKNSDYSDYQVSADDYGVGVLVADKSSVDMAALDAIRETDPKRYQVQRSFRLYMYWTACLLNYLAEHDFSTASADTLWNAMVQNGNTPESLFIVMRSQGYVLQPLFGEKIDGAGNVIKGESFTYDVMLWERGSNLDEMVWGNEPLYESGWKLPGDGYESVAPLIDSVEVMYDAYRAMLRNLPSVMGRYGRKSVLDTMKVLGGLSEDFTELLRTVYRIRVYQMFAQESVFGNKSMIGMSGMRHAFKGNVLDIDESDPFVAYSSYAPMWSMPGRLMVPVRAYRKKRVKYKRFGRTRHRTKYIYEGVRWAEIQFIDSNVYQAYPQVDVVPGTDVSLDSDMTVEVQPDNTYRYVFADPLPDDVREAESVILWVGNPGNGNTVGMYEDLVPDGANALVGQEGPGVGDYIAQRARVPLPKSQRDDTKYPITISYRMPHLPYDSELRAKAFSDYGPLSQDRLFSASGDASGFGISGEERHDGWKIFHESSGSLRDLRCGTTTIDNVDVGTGVHAHARMLNSLGIHEKAAMLLRILKDEFGDARVRLVETYRSMEDQASVCLGSSESAFLSWHNYGLAVKIVVYEEDLSTPADLYGDEFKRMIPIAKAFTNACLNGRIGEPCNVIWCRRLMVGPSLFDWEFLPIGVGHKDAPKFREDVVNLMDPMLERSYVDVDRAGYVKRWKRNDASYKAPYVLDSSSSYRNAIVVNGGHYVEPSRIRNYPHVSDIVLYDAKEYVDLIKLKMDAHGTTRVPGVDMFAWLSGNPISSAQLVRYFAMLGNLSGARDILSGQYFDRYSYITTMFYSSDPVRYVKEMLGERYADVAITVDRDGDSSFISLSDGRLHVKAQDAYPDMPASDQDRFMGRQATPERILRGNWYDGRFYTYDERPIEEIVSPEPVIDGYRQEDGSWVPSTGDAVTVHAIVAAQIKKEYDTIGKRFKDYAGPVMYDRVEDGPNYSMADMLENEFGLIAAQDLLDFDDLEDAIAKDAISDANPGIGPIDGVADIYEKVVNNAEVAGMKRAELTREHVHINDRAPGLTIEDMYRKLTEKGYTANKLMAK